MRLLIWDIFMFLYRHKLKILAVTVLCFALSCFYVDYVQTYSAEVVIRYKDSCVANGKALDGSTFDPNEIVSPKVIVNANRDLPFNIKDDDIRANTAIIPVASADEESIKQAKLKQGESYTYHSNVYRVSYRGNKSFFETRDTLDQLIENYFEYYNEKYIYLATISEIDYDLNQGEFDYIEQAEILQNNIDQAIEVLESYVDGQNYRSPRTGLTFSDMVSEFNYLAEFRMPQIYSKIYAARLSKNTPLLINKYTERKEQHELNAKNSQEKAALAEDRMNAYVEANVDVPNSYNEDTENGRNGAVILDRVEDDWDRVLQEQTTYDTLIKNYVNECIGVDRETIDAQECANIVQIFSTPADEGVNYDQYLQEVERDIAQTLDKLRELYATALLLIDDYNSYIPQRHIECLTGIRTYQNVYRGPYVILATFMGFTLSCIAAVVYEIMREYARSSRLAEHLESKRRSGPREEDAADEIISSASLIADFSSEHIDDISL